MLSTNQKGAIAETRIIAAAIELGMEVYRPVVEGGRYDLILGVGDRLLRTQCKWARRNRDVIVISIRTSRFTPRVCPNDVLGARGRRHRRMVC